MDNAYCADCEMLLANATVFCPNTGKRHRRPGEKCPKCNLLTPFCPSTGEPHQGLMNRSAEHQSTDALQLSTFDRQTLEAMKVEGFGIFAPDNPAIRNLGRVAKPTRAEIDDVDEALRAKMFGTRSHATPPELCAAIKLMTNERKQPLTKPSLTVSRKFRLGSTAVIVLVVLMVGANIFRALTTGNGR